MNSIRWKRLDSRVKLHESKIWLCLLGSVLAVWWPAWSVSPVSFPVVVASASGSWEAEWWDTWQCPGPLASFPLCLADPITPHSLPRGGWPWLYPTDEETEALEKHISSNIILRVQGKALTRTQAWLFQVSYFFLCFTWYLELHLQERWSKSSHSHSPSRSPHRFKVRQVQNVKWPSRIPFCGHGMDRP